MSGLYHHVPHKWISLRKEQGPVTTGQLPSATPEVPVSGNPVIRFNARFAIICTTAVGSMWCAYLFIALALSALPQALKPGNIGFWFWLSSDFFQLTLLSVIIVGQNIQAAKAVELTRVQAVASDQRADQTFRDAEAILHECLSLQAHLQAQDGVLEKLIEDHR